MPSLSHFWTTEKFLREKRRFFHKTTYWNNLSREVSCFTSVLRQCKNHGQKFWMETSIFQQFPIAKSVYKRIPKISNSDIFEHHFYYKILENFMLLKFNREKLQLEFNEGSYKCCQCGLRKLGEECVYEDACPHVVCKSCLQRHYHKKHKNRETLS